MTAKNKYKILRRISLRLALTIESKYPSLTQKIFSLEIKNYINYLKNNQIKNNILPRNDDDPEHKKISASRFDVFAQDEERKKEKALKESYF